MTALPRQPRVSVVIPMLDELDHIGTCLDAFAAQTYPSHLLEVLVVDGGSGDGSRQLVEDRLDDEPWVRIVENPDRRASAAFNRGFEAATGDVVCIFSSHGTCDEDFVERSVAALQETGATGVGGKLLHEGTDPDGVAIGLAMTSPFGMASPFRFADEPREVDTIGHPAYVRDRVLPIGPFDEALERNSDYEYNWRLRDAGHVLVFDPSIVTRYRPRGSLAALARQFWWYGRWKERVIRRHPRSLRPRHLVAPAFVLGLAGAVPLLAWRPGRRLVTGGLAAYASLVGLATARTQPGAHGARPATVAAAFPVMHVCWGAGFLASLLEDAAAGAPTGGSEPARGEAGVGDGG